MRNTLKAYSNAKELLKHNKDKYCGYNFVDVYGRKVNLWDSKDSLGEDFFGAKEGTEEADDILFALQVQYGDPKLTYDECRKEFTGEEVKRAIAYVKRDKLNKFTYFNDSLDKRQRNILAKHILNCNSDKELLDIIYELIDWDNKLFDKAMDIYEGEGSVQYRAKKISDLLTY